MFRVRGESIPDVYLNTIYSPEITFPTPVLIYSATCTDRVLSYQTSGNAMLV